MTEKIITYIESELLNGQDNIQLTPDEDLLTTGLIDSLGIMKLIAWLEEEFSVKIPPEDMTIENFLSPEVIENYIGTLK